MNGPYRSAQWLVHQAPEGPIRSRLICLPYACGNARVFHGWAKSLPGVEVIAIEAPGKGARLLEPPSTNLDDLCNALMTEITPLAEQSLPYSFFGHSYGGLLAYELCNRLQAAGTAMPQRLLLSACGAPWARTPQSYSTLDDAAFMDLLVEYNATPPEVLANEAMLALLWPGLRADFAMVERYQSSWPPLNGVPVHLFHGEEDDIAVDELLAWQQRIVQTISLESLPGGHFFIHDEKDGLLEAIATQLHVRPTVLTF
jgi:medium-chain acyl-[acyl-carrier-protein] hydrolase